MAKKRGVPKTVVKVNKTHQAKFPYRYCRWCKSKYFGVEKDAKTGEELRVFDCRETCKYTQHAPKEW